MIVLAIETSTPRTSIALGNENEILGSIAIAGKSRQESVTPALQQLLRWTGLELDHIGGVAAGLGPGLFTGLRAGVETAKTLAQVLTVPIIGVVSLDALAYRVRHTDRTIASVIDARRGEVFFSLYKPVPGGVVRQTEPAVSSPEGLAAELEALPGEILAVGDGAIAYRHHLEHMSSRVEIATASDAHPNAEALVELAAPRFVREEFGHLFDVVPLYLRRSDAEIAWDKRARGVQG